MCNLLSLLANSYLPILFLPGWDMAGVVGGYEHFYCLCTVCDCVLRAGYIRSLPAGMGSGGGDRGLWLVYFFMVSEKERGQNCYWRVSGFNEATQ